MVEVSCHWCGKKFKVVPAVVLSGCGKYCSPGCYHKSRRKRLRRSCLTCGKAIEVQPYDFKLGYGKYCSIDCKSIGLSKQVKRQCIKCGQKFSVRMSDFKKTRCDFCSVKCFLAYRGESTIEKMFREELERGGLVKGEDFDQEVPIDIYFADFLFYPNLVVECDGGYWHNREYAKRRDYEKDITLSLYGYKVLRFSEDEIKDDVGSCVDEVHIILTP